MLMVFPSRRENFFFKNKDLYLFILEGEGERTRRDTSMCERNIDRLPPALPQLGTRRNPCMCLEQNQTSNFSVCRRTPNPLSYTSQSENLLFLCNLNEQTLNQRVKIPERKITDISNRKFSSFSSL